MNRIALISLVVLSVVVSVVLAEEPAVKEPAPGGVIVLQGVAAEQGAVRSWGVPQQEQMAKVCGLSDEQVKKIADINAARDKALQEARAANAEKSKALMQTMRDAQAKGDTEAAKAAQQEMQGIWKQSSEIQQKAQAEVTAVLTPEQQAKWNEHQAFQTVTMQLWGVKLTEDQTATIKTMVSEALKDVPAGDVAARNKAIFPLVEKVKKDVLTDEQRAAMPKPRVINLAPGQPAAGGAAQPGAPAGGAGGNPYVIIKEAGKETVVQPGQPAGGGGVIIHIQEGQEKPEAPK